MQDLDIYEEINKTVTFHAEVIDKLLLLQVFVYFT